MCPALFLLRALKRSVSLNMGRYRTAGMILPVSSYPHNRKLWITILYSTQKTAIVVYSRNCTKGQVDIHIHITYTASVPMRVRTKARNPMDVTRYAQMVNDGQNIETVAEMVWNESGRIAGQYQLIWKAIADKVSATTKATKYNGSRGTIKHMIRSAN